jgi:eukaryotic-like serine/threonine-protein kinase
MDVDSSNSVPTVPPCPIGNPRGRRVGSYLLQSELGRGGMGSVWLARRDDGQYDAQVAIKLLATAWLGPRGEMRFRQEGMLLARLDHPNIARLLDAGVTEQGEPYLVIEYVDGDRVDDYCRKAGLDIRARIELFLELLSAVAHAHRNLVLHRDIKPANVLVTAEGNAKLLDFGIGKLVEGERALTRTGHSLLTPEYAAPEQLLGEPVTTATDIYTLGLLLYVILAGRHPYLDAMGSPAELLRRITSGAMPLPSSAAMTSLPGGSHSIADQVLQRELRGDLDNIVLKAMHPAPEQRYQDVGAFAADLRRFLKHEPVSARAGTTWYRLRKFVRRNRVAMTASCIMLLSATVAASITITQMLEARRQRGEARQQELTLQRFTDFLNYGLFPEAAVGMPARTMDERLARGAAMLERQYAEDPAFAATLLIQLTERISMSGATTTPERLLQRAYELSAKAGDMSLIIYSRCTQARRLVMVGKTAAGDAFMKEAKGLIARTQPDLDVQVECLLAEYFVEQMHGRRELGKGLLLDAAARLEQAGQAESMTYAAVLSYLTGAHAEASEYAAAIDTAQRSAELERRIGRADTSQHATTLQNLASLLIAVGEVSKSLAEREALDPLWLKIYTPQTMPPAIQNNYAAVLLRMERFEEALKLLDPNLKRIRDAGNPAALLQMLHTKAAVHLALREWAAVESALTEAQPLVDQEAGPPSLLSQVAARHAELAFARNDPARARQQMATALSLAGYGTDHAERSLPRVLMSASRIALAGGHQADAERYAGDALRSSEAIARGPATSADVGEALLLLAKARATTQSHDRQRALLERAVQCLTNGLGQNHSMTLEARALLDKATVPLN